MRKDDVIRLRKLREQVEQARNFLENTCPASRHLYMMADYLSKGEPYQMLADEPLHCAETMLAVLGSLWKARTELAKLNAVAQAPNAQQAEPNGRPVSERAAELAADPVRGPRIEALLERIDELKSLAESEGSRAVSYLRRARAGEAKLAKQEPDDDAVDAFAVAMKEKLAAARAKGRGGWQECDSGVLSGMLREHVEKGDVRDVANFCMFLWSLGYGIAQAPNAQQAEAQEPVEYQFQDRNGKWHGFMDERHRLNTIADGTWPIRQLFTRPQPAQLQALSEEEVMSAWVATGGLVLPPEAMDFARSVQSALAAKNGAVLK